MIDLFKIKNSIEVNFADIIDEISINEINEMRIFLIDETFIDIWFSLKSPGRYSYHWERRFKDGTIHRHDNIPHKKWKYVKTFPKHYHDTKPENVTESYIDDDVGEAINKFLDFVRKELKK